MKPTKFNSALFGIFLVLVLSILGLTQMFHQSDETHPKILSTNLTRVGNWPFGAAQAVAADTTRKLVYLGSGGAVLVLDVSDLSDPQLVSDVINTTGSVVGLSYNPSTRLLFAATRYEGLQIWDMNDPAAPVQLAIYDLPDPYADPPMNNVDFYSNYVITENSFDGVNSIDVSDPENPAWVSGNLDMGNPARDIYVALDGRLHTAGAQNYIKIYIESNGHLSSGYLWHTLDGPSIASGNSDAAFVGVNDFLVILNTQSISYPVWSYRQVGYMSDIAVQGDFVYFGVDYRLQIYDVSDYQNPVPAGSYTLPAGYPQKLDVKGDVAYLAGNRGGLRNVDVTDPYIVSELGYYETFSATSDMVRSGDYAFIAELDDGILVLDLSDMSNPTLVGQYDTPGNAGKIEMAGDLIYVADGAGGLRIADISDPVHPAEISFFDSLSWAREVCINGDYAYIVDDIVNQPDYIRAIDISDPINPTEVGSILMQSNVYALDADGNYLYAAVTDQGMRVLDISNPANPVEVGLFLAPDVFDVKVRGNYAYLASDDFAGGFIILDISDPTLPLFVSAYNPVGYQPWDVTLAGDYAYISEPVSNFLYLMYIGDPTNPRELGSYRFSGDIYELSAQDSLIYISDGEAGLQIFKNDIYSTPSGGITWQPQLSGTTEDLWATCFVNSTTGWAAGDNGIIVKTTNGGQSWIPKASGTSTLLFTVFFLDQTTGWAAGRDGVIIKSTDGGESWQPQNSGVTVDDIRSVQFIDSDIGWAAGENGRILHTQDGGDNWQPQSSGTTDYLSRIIFTDGLHGWAAGQNGLILKTTDGGVNWNNVYLPTSAYSVYDVYFLNPDTGWAVTTDVEVFKTTNGGQTWIKQYENKQSPYDVITSINFIDENYGWAVGYNGKVIGTSNGGDTWIEETSGVQEYLTCVYFADRFSGWIAGKGGTILKAVPAVTAIGNDGIVPRNLPDKIVLHNNYPNPFNPSTTIQYELPKRSRVTLKIYDILGKEIKTLMNGVQSAGLKSVTWDGRDNEGRTVSSGIYFYTLKTNNFAETKKMVIIR